MEAPTLVQPALLLLRLLLVAERSKGTELPKGTKAKFVSCNSTTSFLNKLLLFFKCITPPRQSLKFI